VKETPYQDRDTVREKLSQTTTVMYSNEISPAKHDLLNEKKGSKKSRPPEGGGGSWAERTSWLGIRRTYIPTQNRKTKKAKRGRGKNGRTSAL